MADVSLRNIRKSFASTAVVHGIDLEINNGEFIVLVGPSGCGKSTLLRMVAGLEPITEGELWIGDTKANELRSQDRNIAMVFQSYALYPHLSVYENIAFGPRTRGEKESDFKPRIEQAADMLNLRPYLDRQPRALSGGQRQRVAMGRAVVREPSLFLFDEPLSNLDAQLRVQMRTEIKQLHHRLRNTIIYVTHDQIEAMTMADRIVVMNAGRVEQIGKPLELYDFPANRFVAGFIGSPSMNFVHGHVCANSSKITLSDNSLIDIPTDLKVSANQKITLGLRPEHIRLADSGIALKIYLVESTGAETHIHGKVEGSDTSWSVSLRERVDVSVGQTVYLQAQKPGLIHAFDFDSGKTLRANPNHQ